MCIRNIVAGLLFLFILPACSSEPYTYEMALNNGDVVVLHGNVKNPERLEQFYQNVSLTNKDKIRITQYTIEGDPLFHDFEFSGKDIKYIYDNTHDKFGSQDKRTTICRSLLRINNDLGNEFRLVGCEGKNKEEGHQFKVLVKHQR